MLVCFVSSLSVYESWGTDGIRAAVAEATCTDFCEPCQSFLPLIISLWHVITSLFLHGRFVFQGLSVDCFTGEGILLAVNHRYALVVRSPMRTHPFATVPGSSMSDT